MWENYNFRRVMLTKLISTSSQTHSAESTDRIISSKIKNLSPIHQKVYSYNSRYPTSPYPESIYRYLLSIINDFFSEDSRDNKSVREFCELAFCRDNRVINECIRRLNDSIRNESAPNASRISAVDFFLDHSCMEPSDIALIGACLISKLDGIDSPLTSLTFPSYEYLFDVLKKAIVKEVEAGITDIETDLFKSYEKTLMKFTSYSYYPVKYKAKLILDELEKLKKETDKPFWAINQRRAWALAKGLTRMGLGVADRNVSEVMSGMDTIIRGLLDIDENTDLLPVLGQKLKETVNRHEKTIRSEKLLRIQCTLSAITHSDNETVEQYFREIEHCFRAKPNRGLLFGIILWIEDLYPEAGDPFRQRSIRLLEELLSGNTKKWGLRSTDSLFLTVPGPIQEKSFEIMLKLGKRLYENGCNYPKDRLKALIKTDPKDPSFKEKTYSLQLLIVNQDVDRAIEKQPDSKKIDFNLIIPGSDLVPEEPEEVDEASDINITGPLTDDVITAKLNLFKNKLYEMKDQVESVDTTPVEGSVRGLFSGSWRMKQDDLEQLINRRDGNVNIKRRNRHGIRDLGIVVTESGRSFHFKHLPEFPCYELSVNMLGLILFGESVLHEVLDIYIDGKWALFLVAETIQGDNMADYLRWTENLHETDRNNLSRALQELIDPVSFGIHSIMAMICRFQDQKPDNLILRRSKQPLLMPGKKAIAAIDNERSFVSDKKSGYWTTKSGVQSIFFCMDQMRNPLHHTVLSYINAWEEPKYLIQRWLQRIQDMDTNLKNTFSKDRLNALSFQNIDKTSSGQQSFLSFDMQPAIVVKLLIGLTQISKAEYPVTPEHLLGKILREAKIAYSKALNEFGSLQRRFVTVTEFSYHSLSSTLRTSDVLLKHFSEELGNNPDFAWLGDPKASSSYQTPERLRTLIPYIETKLVGEMLTLSRHPAADFSDTDLGRFIQYGEELYKMGILYQVMRKVDFSRGMVAAKRNQLRFIKELNALGHRYIIFHGAAHLNNDHLIKAIAQSPQLTKLELVNCASITQIPFDQMPYLEDIYLEGLTLSQKTLDMSKNPRLAKIELINLPGIDDIKLSKSCISLNLEGTYHTEMKTIQLGQTQHLTWENIKGIPEAEENWIDHVVYELRAGKTESLHNFPTTRDLEKVLKKFRFRTTIGFEITLERTVSNFSRYSLQELCFKNVGIHPKRLQPLIIGSPHLKRLTLSFSDNPESSKAFSLTKSQAANILKRCPELEELNLSGNYSLDLSAKELSNLCPNLKTLNLSHTTIKEFDTLGTEGVWPLIEPAHYLKKLEVLDLSHCKKLDRIGTLPTSLKELNVSYSYAQFNSFFEQRPAQKLLAENWPDKILQGLAMKWPDIGIPLEEIEGYKLEVPIDSSIFEDRTISIGLNDGRLCFGYANGDIKIWRLNDDDSVTLSYLMQGHTDKITCLTELENGLLASGSEDGNVRLWRLTDTKGCKAVLKSNQPKIVCLKELKNGNIATGANDGSVSIWQANQDQDYDCIRNFKDHAMEISDVIELKNGFIVTSSGDGNVTIRNWKAKTDIGLVRTLQGHIRGVNSVIELRNGWLATGSKDCVKLWDLQSDSETSVTTLPGSSNHVCGMIALKNGYLVTGSASSISIYDLKRNPHHNPEPLLEKKVDSDVIYMKQLRDGKLLTSSVNNEIKIWSIDNDGDCKLVTEQKGRHVIELKNGSLVVNSTLQKANYSPSYLPLRDYQSICAHNAAFLGRSDY